MTACGNRVNSRQHSTSVASLIGRLGQALSAIHTPVSTSLTGSRFYSVSAPRPLYGIRGSGGTIFTAALLNGRPKRTYELTSYCRRVAQHLHVLHPPRLFLVSVVTASASWEGSWEQFVLLLRVEPIVPKPALKGELNDEITI